MEYLVYLLYFFQSWLMFVTPLKSLRYKSTIGQKVLFTIVYAVGAILSRKMYNFLKVPFGTHTILLIIFSTILFKTILKDISWHRSIYASLITFIILLVNDTFVVLPVLKLFGLAIGKIDVSNILLTAFMGILSNLLLIFAYIAFVVRDSVCNKKGLNSTVSG